MDRINVASSADNYRVVPLDVRTRKPKRTLLSNLAAVKIEWLPLLLGFFLARALLLDELLPFGVAYLAAVRKNPRSRSYWALFGVLAGYASLASVIEIYPYYLFTLIVWFAGSGKRKDNNAYWTFWLVVGFLFIKVPLTLLQNNYPMVWFAAISEVVLAVAGYSIFSALIDRKVYALNSLEFQIVLLLIAILLGVDLSIGGLPLRIIIMFYLIFAAARLDGAGLTFIVGPSLTVAALLLKMPIELAALLVIVAVLSGFLTKIPLGLFISGFAAYLLTFGVPVSADTVFYLIMLVIAGVAVYLTPKKNLKYLERVIPGTKKYSSRQAFHTLRSKTILEQRIELFSKLFDELAAALGDEVYVSQQLSGFAKIVEQLGTEFNANVEFAEIIEDKLWRKLDCPELEELTVMNKNDDYIINGRRRDLCGEGWCRQVAKECEALLGRRFSVTSKKCLVEGKCGFDISIKARYCLDVKTAKIARGKVSGDSNKVFQLSSHKIGLLLSDGMGTGEQAASDSLIATNLLERMISIGYDPELAVKIINQTLLARSSLEAFVTVDLVVVDLYTGQLDFIKIGAAASFVKRSHKVDVIQNHSLPIGILNHVDLEPEKRMLHAGEYLIMVTDGILEFQRDVTDKDKWISDLLRNCDSDLSSQDMANMLLMHSLEAAGGHVPDDMMVLVAKFTCEETELDPYQRS